MFLISQLEENIYKYGNCTIKMQFEKACESLSIRFNVNNEGLLDVHAFIDTYDRDYWVINGNTTTINRRARITSNRYVKSFDKLDELREILADLTAGMIFGKPICVDAMNTPRDNTKAAANDIGRITTNMLDLSNKELVSFYDMTIEDITAVLLTKPVMSVFEYLGSDTLDMKCEDLMERYNNILKLNHVIYTDLDQIKINEARMMIYRLQNDESNKKFEMPNILEEAEPNPKTHFIR